MKQLKRTSTIIPLSSNPMLAPDQYNGINVYSEILNEAFKNPRIRNIAVTGSWGVGKSSLLKSFNRSRSKFLKKSSKFLYINLGEYAVPNFGKEDANIGNTGNATKTVNVIFRHPDSDGKERQANYSDDDPLEQRLLLQVLTRFRDCDIPGFGLHKIPKEPHVTTVLAFCVFVLSTLLLLLKAPISELLHNWHPEPACSWLENIIQFILGHHEYFEIILYSISVVGVIILLGWVFKRLYLSINTSALSVKTTVAEVNLQQEKTGDYLDQYTQELICFLEKNCKRYDRTVVFEDMDRLDAIQCIRIFTRLREINHMLNSHLSNKKYIRFIYVIKDELASALECHKFFDYIVPVVPTLNRDSSETIFRNYLEQINCELVRYISKKHICDETGVFGYRIICCIEKLPWLKKRYCMLRDSWKKGKPEAEELETAGFNHGISKKASLINLRSMFYYRTAQNDKKDLFRKVSIVSADNLVYVAAPVLTDYRQMFSIFNEYALMVKLYHSNNATKLSADDIEKILALQIYKHLFPEDYYRLLTGQDCAPKGKWIDGISAGHAKLLKHMSDNQLLSTDSLYYAGFSREQIESLEKKRLDNWAEQLAHANNDGVLAMIRGRTSVDVAYLTKMIARCRVGSISPPVNSAVLVEVIRLIVTHGFGAERDLTWFFTNRTVTDCLQVFVELQQQDGGSIENCRKFIDLCTRDENYGIFKGCKLPGNYALIMVNAWTKEQAIFFAAGAPQKVMADIVSLIDGRSTTVRELYNEYQEKITT